MKKIFFNIFALALATMVGCQKSDITDNNGSNNETQLITVTATIDDATKTRVALTPDTDGESKPIVKVAWKDSGDTFRVYGVEEDPITIYGPTTFTQIDDTNNFSGTDPYQHSWYYFATYPASDLITIQKVASEVKICYDKGNFTSQNGFLSEERTLMYDEISGNIDNNTQFNFKHLTTLLMPRFRIVGESVNLGVDKIASITFKDMLIPDGTADFNIDCTSHAAEDNIYVYLPFVADGCYGDDASYSTKKTTIEVVVNTTDAKIYEGSITIPAGTTLALGKLYTAAFWLTRKEFTNVITYTTTNDAGLSLDYNWGEGDGRIYTSHTFAYGIGRIVLKDGITSIPGYGFNCSYYLQSIELPSAITTIGNSAFSGATSLSSINLQYITTIEDNAFQNCSKLSQITMPDNEYDIIGFNNFASTAITEIDLSNAKSIGNYTFLSCSKLRTAIINNTTIPTFGEYNPFMYCEALESIYVPDAKVDEYKAVSALLEVAEKIKPI